VLGFLAIGYHDESSICFTSLRLISETKYACGDIGSANVLTKLRSCTYLSNHSLSKCRWNTICFSQGFVPCKSLQFLCLRTKCRLLRGFLTVTWAKLKVRQRETKWGVLFFTEKEWGGFDLFRENDFR